MVASPCLVPQLAGRAHVPIRSRSAATSSLRSLLLPTRGCSLRHAAQPHLHTLSQLHGSSQQPPSSFPHLHTSSTPAPWRSQPHAHRRMLRSPLASSALTHGSTDSPPVPSTTGNGTFLLMLLCVLGFLLDHVFHVPGFRDLYLHNAQPQWWQFISHQFCHANLAHLSSNLFQLCVFGRFVEEMEGSWGVVFIFLLTGLGAALLTSLFLRNSVSVGASGAIFGLFATSVLLRLTQGLNFKLLLEAAVLGNFVVRQVLGEVRAEVMGGTVRGGLQVAHIAHLGGALAGALLVLLVIKITHVVPTAHSTG